MKESLSLENRKDIVQYRLERAVDTLAEARYTAEGQRHTADYEDFINCDVNTIKMYLPLVENFVLSIKHHIEEMDIINDNNEPL